MDSTTLHDLFRSEVRDEATPYLWSDVEVYSFIDDAQKMFCRLQGGIADASSAITHINVVAGSLDQVNQHAARVAAVLGIPFVPLHP